MEILIKVLQFFLSFTLLVTVHEFGHFIFSRIFGVRVEKFYIFFNPWFTLFKFKKGDTEWGLGWLPLGGYCKIAGMIDESMDTEQLKQPAQPDEFRSKPAWQRLLIMVGGVLMNVVLAFVIYIGISYYFGDKYLANADAHYGYVFDETGLEMGFHNGDKIVSVGGEPVVDMADIYKKILLNAPTTVEIIRTETHPDHSGHTCGFTQCQSDLTLEIDNSFTSTLIKKKKSFLEPRSEFIINEALEGSAAMGAGFVKGDKVVAVNGEGVQFADQVVEIFKANANKTIKLTVFRNQVLDQAPSMFDVEVPVSADGIIGVSLVPFVSTMPVRSHDYTLLQAIPAGFRRTGEELSSYWKQIKMMFTPKTEAYKSLGGMIAIGNIFPSYWSWESFWSITAFLSIILAVMNILPIPALDGGHVLFLIVEIIMGRAPSDKFLEYAQRIGFALLLVLLIYANGNDIYRFIIK